MSLILKGIIRIQVAFEEYNAVAVHNDFEITRDAAIKIHQKADFEIINEYDGIVELLITKENYFKKQNLK